MEQNSRLEITPRAGVYGKHYGGYVSQQAWNVTDRQVSVELVQSTNTRDWAETVFAVGVNDKKWFRFTQQRGQLYFQTMVDGGKSSTQIAYDPTQHRFWRFRHDAAADRILFETSADGQVWAAKRAVPRPIQITALRIELSAGTFNWNDATGTAIFDNLLLGGGSSGSSTARTTFSEIGGFPMIALLEVQHPWTKNGRW
jgi:hypothetical protein